MPKPQHLIDRLSDRISTEVERVSDGMADKLNAELLDDNQELSDAAFRQYWVQNWGDPQWRAKTQERMGARAFVDAANEIFGAPKPEPLSRLAREGMAKRGVAQAQEAVPSTPQMPAPQAPPMAGPGY